LSVSGIADIGRCPGGFDMEALRLDRKRAPDLTVTEQFGDPLEEAAARELTERIRNATQQVCMLLLEAHARRAWIALGYKSWERYVHSEFGISRSRSYQLLDQGRVTVVIQSTAGLSGPLDIHPYAAAQLKPRLAEIVEVVRARTAGLPEPQARDVVAEVIRSERGLASRDRSPRPVVVPARASVELIPLYDAVGSLARMPDPVDAADMASDDGALRLVELRTALTWLTDFTEEWERRQRTADVAEGAH